jgi:hypothetical protein
MEQQQTIAKAAKTDPARVADTPPAVRDALERMHSTGQEGLSARLEILRGERSQREWARDLGVFQQNVNRYENGTTPHPNFLLGLTMQENVDIHWLLTGEGQPDREGKQMRGGSPYAPPKRRMAPRIEAPHPPAPAPRMNLDAYLPKPPPGR